MRVVGTLLVVAAAIVGARAAVLACSAPRPRDVGAAAVLVLAGLGLVRGAIWLAG